MKIAATLQAEIRETVTRGDVRGLRREGKIPAIVYGAGKEPLKISLRDNEFTRIYQKGGIRSKILEIKTENKTVHAIARDLQFHPVSDKIEHADFLYVDENSSIRVAVPVHYAGRDKSPGIKKGGTLNIVRHDVELICKPKDLPDFIEADLSKMQIGDSLHISHIALPTGVTPAIRDRDFTLATVVGRGGKDDQADAAATAPTDPTAVPASTAKADDKKDEKK